MINDKVGNAFVLPTKATIKPDKLKQKLFNAIQICTNENKGHHDKFIELKSKKKHKKKTREAVAIPKAEEPDTLIQNNS